VTSSPIAPVILVHGAWHGSWCWRQLAEHLEHEGIDVSVVTLPGHDNPGSHRRNWARMSQYVETLSSAATSFDQPAVLVGHSMGGYVVQRFLETNTVAAGVLVASVPRRGALGANLRLLKNHPLLTAKATVMADYSGLVGSTGLVGSLFFRPETPAEIVESTYSQLQNESALAISTMIVRPPRPKRVTTPVHVVAASDDAIFTLEEQRDLAVAYGTELQIVASSGHDIMLDTNWEALAQILVDVATSAGRPTE